MAKKQNIDKKTIDSQKTKMSVIEREAQKSGIKIYSPSWSSRWVRRELNKMDVETRTKTTEAFKKSGLNRQQQSIWLQAIEKQNETIVKLEEEVKKHVRDLEGKKFPKNVTLNLSENLYLPQKKESYGLPPLGKDRSLETLERAVRQSNPESLKEYRGNIFRENLARAAENAFDDPKLSKLIHNMTNDEMFMFAAQYEGNMFTYVYTARMSNEQDVRNKTVRRWIRKSKKYVREQGNL